MGADSSEFQVPVKGPAGEDRGTVSIESSRFDERVRYPLLKDAVVMYEANRRVGTHKVKTRGEVAGTTRKPWRQKGTGRARAGTKKSPLWRGGGIVFGPRPRDYSYSMNRKQRRLALRSALLSRFRDGAVVVLDGLELDAPKTRTIASALKALGIEGTCLLGTAEVDRNVVLSARNIPGVIVSPVSDWNARDVLRVKNLVLTRDAFDRLTAERSDRSEQRSEQQPVHAVPAGENAPATADTGSEDVGAQPAEEDA